jgi:hypothetical protein
VRVLLAVQAGHWRETATCRFGMVAPGEVGKDTELVRWHPCCENTLSTSFLPSLHFLHAKCICLAQLQHLDQQPGLEIRDYRDPRMENSITSGVYCLICKMRI